MLTIITEKRPLPVYYPALEDVARLFKKIKTDVPLAQNIDRFASSTATLPSNSSTNPRSVANPVGVSLAHCVPQKFQPIIELPFRVNDFFSDVKFANSDNMRIQLETTLACFPPPKPPMVPKVAGTSVTGAMVPFVYPPLPPIKRDLLMALPTEMKLAPQVGGFMYPLIPPLPFPPVHYMPYPLIAENSPLTPSEVFSLWLTALSNIPRVDMVLASAAGSIFDLRAHAMADGLTIQKLDRMLKAPYDAEEDVYESEMENEDHLDEGLDEYLEFAQNVDTTDTFDPNLKLHSKNLIPTETITRIKYQRISPLTCVDGNTVQTETVPSLEYSSRNLTDSPNYEPPERLLRDLPKEQKDKSKNRIAPYLKEMEHETFIHKRDIYNTKKRNLLKRLEQLQTSKILYDNNDLEIYDEELSSYILQRQTQNDMDLLRLKIQHTYDKLKILMSFYQTSHRLYKTMNSVMVNKLKKLKNFLEHQRQTLEDANSEKHPGEGDVTSIKGRESAKLYSNFVEQDYSAEIKEVFRCAILREEGEKVENDVNTDAAEYSSVYTGKEHEAIVDDYMPLVTENEFKLITGEAPSKTGVSKEVANKTKIARHLIFQSPLYDYGTSGSDTNLSENALPMKRRPGRRAAPKPAYGEESSKQLNDAALVAKIMKLFVGPAGANVEELSNDLGLIGIDTKWPLK